MSYIDYDYYTNEYEGEPVENDDFSRLEKRASEAVDQMTSYQIVKIGLDSFADHVQELIKKATAAQVEYLQVNGLETNVNGQIDGGGSVSIGGFSYSDNGPKSNRQAGRFSPASIAFLQGTGLIRKNGVRMSVI